MSGQTCPVVVSVTKSVGTFVICFPPSSPLPVIKRARRGNRDVWRGCQSWQASALLNLNNHRGNGRFADRSGGGSKIGFKAPQKSFVKERLEQSNLGTPIRNAVRRPDQFLPSALLLVPLAARVLVDVSELSVSSPCPVRHPDPAQAGPVVAHPGLAQAGPMR
jgi:hypothetical protein